MGRRSRLPGIGRVAMLPPAAFAVHQLRYELAYGSGVGAALRESGHSYLHSVVPWLVALVAIAIGVFLLSVGRAFTSRASADSFSMSFCALWTLCTLALVLIFACQETLEGLFATGHPSGWTGVFGDGGWWSVPVAVGIGLILAAIFHGASWAVGQVVRWRRRPSRRRVTVMPVGRPVAVLAPPPVPLLAGWSNRGPPTPRR